MNTVIPFPVLDCRPSEVWTLDEYDVAILETDSSYLHDKLQRLDYLVSLGLTDEYDQREMATVIRDCIEHLAEVQRIGKERGEDFDEYQERIREALTPEA